MLEIFKQEQENFYRVITTAISSGRISHAYFIEDNGYLKTKDLIFSFVKYIISQKMDPQNNDVTLDSIFHLIDEGVYDDVKMIEPDGQWIKKEQLLSLQIAFQTKSLHHLPRIYVIFQADKLNRSAANSILKFLEEPEDDIIAILVAHNRYQMLPTILSRCQIYSLENHETTVFDGMESWMDGVMDFCYFIDTKKIDTIAYYNSIFSNVKSRDDWNQVLSLIFHVYEALFENHLGQVLPPIFQTYERQVRELFKNNDTIELGRKMKIVLQAMDRLKVNANQNLLLDYLVIRLCGGVYD